MENKIKVGIVGGAGYTGGELIRILLQHPQCTIDFVHSQSHAGHLLAAVHTDLLGDTDMLFTDVLNPKVDVVFLCVGHGAAESFLTANPFPPSVKIIDLSQDFRHRKNAQFQDRNFVYGLPELNADKIKTAQNIANPGCFATCIQLGLLPLAKAGLINAEVHINATTGSTGAGQGLSKTSHFSWRSNNLSVYKAFEHQHLQEITESLTQLQTQFNQGLNFIPQRGDFARGIFAAMYLDSEASLDAVYALYEAYYQAHPFTHVSRQNIDLKQVVNTNKCLIHLEQQGGKLLILSITDNLLKGASGQAVQNMNLMFGIAEDSGLRLKASYF